MHNASFNLYSQPWKDVSLADLIADPMTCAEAAFSGSEGCYCEVAKWSESRNRYERFAFAKFFDGDVEGKTAYQIASELAVKITESKGFHGFIHTLPEYSEEEVVA